jgi:hypothetical protein
MPDVREPSHPPSEPQPPLIRSISDAAGGLADRPVRIQLFVAALLGLVLVATGLYLWRRPRAALESAEGGTAIAAAAAASTTSNDLLLADAGIAAAVAAQLQPDNSVVNGVAISDARVVGCHDKGSKKTAAAECDHLPPVEQALAKAIGDAATCAPSAAGGGSLEYLVDVSFNRKHNPVKLSLPKDGRSMKSAKALVTCKSAVQKGIVDVPLDAVTHEHQRYEIAITATYPSGTATR